MAALDDVIRETKCPAKGSETESSTTAVSSCNFLVCTFAHVNSPKFAYELRGKTQLRKKNKQKKQGWRTNFQHDPPTSCFRALAILPYCKAGLIKTASRSKRTKLFAEAKRNYFFKKKKIFLNPSSWSKTKDEHKIRSLTNELERKWNTQKFSSE